MNKFNQGTFIFAGVTALLTLPISFLWLFGTPGVDGDYAQGWSLGFTTLIYYFLGCLLIVVAFALAHWGARKYPQVRPLSSAIAVAFWGFFGYSLFNIFRAFEIMGRAY